MNSHIVIGLGFGDEGKGITTDYLASNLDNSFVIRFSGGQQAGHTVVDSFGNRHVFSNFGSGTLRGVPTYWSKYCTFHPNGLIKEYDALSKLLPNMFPVGAEKLFVDALAQVTTPYDILYNQALEFARQQPVGIITGDKRHGSCGVGIGTTVERNLTPYKLYVQDLSHPVILEQKLNAIKSYYQDRLDSTTRLYYKQWDLEDAKSKFLEAVKRTLDITHVVCESDFFLHHLGAMGIENLIFEGSQGILLDMDFGFFPNVTRANVTCKNAMAMLNEYGLNSFEDGNDGLHMYYITRAYQTRHGAGFMTNEHLPLKLKENPLETNVFNEWQTDFRKSVLDIDLINYAINCNANFFPPAYTSTLVVTCLDQIDGDLRATLGGELKTYKNDFGFIDITDLAKDMDEDFNYTLGSYSDCSDNLPYPIKKKL